MPGVSSNNKRGKKKNSNVNQTPETVLQGGVQDNNALNELNNVNTGPTSIASSSGFIGPSTAVAVWGTRLVCPWSEQQNALNLSSFKVFPCTQKHSTLKLKSCPFYHNVSDRRRFPVAYRAEQCTEHYDTRLPQLHCSKGDRCQKCHNKYEFLYHPNNFKQRFCASYVANNGEEWCVRGEFCAFAHSRPELRAPLFSIAEETNPSPLFLMHRFKTLWCPYGVQHDWFMCTYAHTYQDCRRVPQIGYCSAPCSLWKKEGANYARRCPHGTLCPNAHGSIEQLYHPTYYKTQPCADYNAQGELSCPRGVLCAFYHEVSEKRNALRPVVELARRLPPQRNSLLQVQFLKPPFFLDDSR